MDSNDGDKNRHRCAYNILNRQQDLRVIYPDLRVACAECFQKAHVFSCSVNLKTDSYSRATYNVFNNIFIEIAILRF